MRFEVVVFDFDGTLVDSAAAKYRTFFKLFPDTPEHRAVVAAVLKDDPDGSRYVVIPRMIEQMTAAGLALPPGTVAAGRADEYSRLVLQAVTDALEIPGASRLLQDLRGRCATYISSQTPEASVRSMVQARGWDALVSDVFGYPRDKTVTVAELLSLHGIAAGRLAVIGDGASDQRSAAANDCVFFPVRRPEDLAAIGHRLVSDGV
jgi:phosphoglycolate phosphatase-like HAD superfamily hydrolase